MRGIGLALATAALLAGCSSGTTQARALPTPSRTSVSPSPSPTVEQQVEAAVREYFDAANHALATGDTTHLESLSLPGCGCRELVAFVKKTYASGLRPKSAAFEVGAVLVHDLVGATAAATAEVGMDEYDDVDSAGHVVMHYPAHHGNQDLSLVQHGVRWVISNAVRLD